MHSGPDTGLRLGSIIAGQVEDATTIGPSRKAVAGIPSLHSDCTRHEQPHWRRGMLSSASASAVPSSVPRPSSTDQGNSHHMSLFRRTRPRRDRRCRPGDDRRSRRCGRLPDRGVLGRVLREGLRRRVPQGVHGRDGDRGQARGLQRRPRPGACPDRGRRRALGRRGRRTRRRCARLRRGAFSSSSIRPLCRRAPTARRRPTTTIPA